MISLVRGPGGLFGRLAADFVPLLLAVAVGATLLMVVPPLLAAILAGLAWPMASWVLRRVRQRPALRRLYRIALALHVVFWSAQGVLATRTEPAADAEVTGRTAWAEAGAFEAGYGEAAFTLPDGTPLGGWGARPRRKRLPAFGGFGIVGRHAQRWMATPDVEGRPRLAMFRGERAKDRDDGPGGAVGARAVVMRPVGEGAPFVIVRLDLVTSDAELHAAILRRAAMRGVRAETLLVTATHTHSGPGAYSRNEASALFGTGHPRADVTAAIVDAAGLAIERAFDAAVPARMAVAEARDRDPATGKPILARNRRRAEDGIDDRVLALCLDARDTGAAIAVVLNYAVHPYLYRRRHLGFTRDLAGGLEDALAAKLPGAPGVLFVNGAMGDVSTQPVEGVPAVRIGTLAGRFADALVPAVAKARADARDTLRLAAARSERRMGTPRALLPLAGERAGVVAALDRPYTDVAPAVTIADALALPANVVIWSLGVPEARVGFTFEGDLGAVVNLEPKMGNPPLAFGAWILETGRGDAATRTALLAQPGEAMQSLGRAWRAEAAAHGIERAFVVGLANGSCGYVTPSADFGARGYEYDSTLFGPGTGDDVTEALALALEAARAALGE